MADIREQCKIALKEALGERGTPAKVASMQKRIETEVDGSLDPRAYIDAYKKIVTQDARDAEKAVQRANADALALKRSTQVLDQNLKEEYKGLREVLRLVDDDQNAITIRTKGEWINELKEAGVYDRSMKLAPDEQLQVRRQMAIKTGGREAPVTDVELAKIGDIHAKYVDRIKNIQNDVGADIVDLTGYITKTNWVVSKLRGKGTPADQSLFVERMLPRLDDRFFEGVGTRVEDRISHLKSTWNALVGKVHGGETPYAGAGSNLARRLSEHRELTFKDAQAWSEVNAWYGINDLTQEVATTIERGSNNVGLMRWLGTNPEAGFTELVDRQVAKANGRANAGDLTANKEISKIKGEGVPLKEKKILSVEDWNTMNPTSLYKVLDGSIDIPDKPGVASFFRGGRALMNMAKMGKVFLNTFGGDIVTRAVYMERNGAGFLNTLLSGVKAEIAGVPKNIQQEFGYRAASVAEGLMGRAMARMNAGETFNGALGKGAEFMMTINLFKRHNNTQTVASLLDLQATMGLHSEKAWTQLPGTMRKQMQQSQITEPMWDYLRKNAIADTEGRAQVHWDRIALETDDGIRAIMGKPKATPTEVGNFRDDFIATMDRYMVREVRRSMTEPDAVTKLVQTWGLQAGSLPGEFARSAMQYKSFSIQYARQHLFEDWGNEGGKTRILTKLLPAMTASGYLATVLGDLALGKTPAAPENFEESRALFIKSALRGGGLGILGDLMFNEMGRNGVNSYTALGGPLPGALADTAVLAGHAVAKITGSAEKYNLKSDLLKAGLDFAPFLNLFYTQAAMNALFLDGLHEWANPGYKGRVRENMAKQNQQFLW